MTKQVLLSFVLLAGLPAWPQVSTADGGVGLNLTDETATPPPVNGNSYPTATGAERRSNYLRVGLVFTSGYSDNVLGYTSNPVSDFDYSIYPTIAISKTTSRVLLDLDYSPGFTFYQQTTSRNQANEALGLNFEYRLSPHVSVTLRDNFRQTSSVLYANPLSGDATSVPQSPTTPIIGPVGDQISNSADAQLNYQFRKNGTIGASGTFTNLHYLDPSQVPGLYDSSSSGGAAFYSHRLSKRHYLGGHYQYAKTLAYPLNIVSTVQTNALFVFYTLYLTPTFSVSVSGGPQHYQISQVGLTSQSSWTPTVVASGGWQGRHTNVSASYSHVVFGGGGLVGVFKSDQFNVFGRWQVARYWNLGVTGGYGNNRNVTPSAFLSTEGGHSIYGTITANRQLSERLNVGFGYTRLQENYGFIQSNSGANTDREFVSVSYRFQKPLGE
jgi:hypothetical protein